MDPRALRTREALLAAAERLFLDRPLDDVTLDEIAAEAGVAVGSVYNHFGSKAGLHAALVEQALAVDRVHMDLAYGGDHTPVGQIRAAAEQYLEFAMAHPAHFRMLAFPPDPGRYAAGRRTAEELAERVHEQNARLVEAITRGVADGVLRPIDPGLAATVLWAAWNGIIGLAWRPDALRQEEPELRELLRVATDIIESGLLARPSPPSPSD